jgi:hypothetical protein
MILKKMDESDVRIQELETALRQSPPANTRRNLDKELAIRRAGIKGEEEAAYHIDFHLKNHPNWVVLHDFRIESRGRVAQIDHLLISRLLGIYVVESKSFRTKVRYANGGWERLNFNHWEGIPCPVEQNERHIAVLKDLLAEHQLAPTRLGLPMTPTIYNIVVVMPTCSVPRNVPEAARIYRVDTLVKKIRNQDPAALDIFKVISCDTLMRFGNKLAGHHRPQAKPQPQPKPIGNQPNPPATTAPALKCQSCGGSLSAAEARFCHHNKGRFGGQVLCRKCQDYAPKYTPTAPRKSPEPRLTNSAVAACSQCGATVDSKVVFYCKAVLKLQGGRVLCRTCQKPAPAGIPKPIPA